MRNTYYCCLGLNRRHGQSLRRSMDELSRFMAQPPLEEPYRFVELADDKREKIQDAFDHCTKLDDFLGKVVVTMTTDMLPLLILCPPESTIAQLARKRERTACWGASFGDRDECSCYWLSLVYHLNDKHTIWHEALHLLGADDCYDKETKERTCELPNCIMQFEDPKQGYGQGLPLCQANIERVKKHIAEMRKDHSSDAPHRLQ